jgi:hypothetical protein
MKRIATLAAGLALVLPGGSAAAASSSTCQAYNPQLCSITHNSRASSGTLPFTGLDAALLLAGGGGLLGAGLAVRRISGRLN